MSAILNLIYNAWDVFPVIPLLNMAMFGLVMMLFLAILKVRRLPRTAQNPFSKKNIRPTSNIEFDQKKRDAVIKQGFSSKHIPENLDAIIIGSGMGGLSCGSLMANAGKKVLVLEQHDQAGGCMHTFIDKGFEFDVGVHYLGEMGGLTLTKVLLDQISGGQIQWEPLDDAFDVVAIGDHSNPMKVEICKGEDNFKRNLLETFPDEEQAIDNILKLFKDAKKSVAGYAMVKSLPYYIAWFFIKTGLINRITPYFKYASMSLSDALNKYTDNEELKAVFAYSFGDYGTPPSKAPLTMHAMLFHHYSKGGYYPRGGSSEFAYHMVPIVENAGGKVLVRARVSSILMDRKGRANGVRVTKGGSDFDIFAPIIISDAGVYNTFTKLIPERVSQRSNIQNILRHCQHGVGAMSIFVGLEGTKEELNLKRQNCWAFTKSDLDGELNRYLSLDANDAVDSEIPLMFISFPSSKDSTWEQRYPGKSTCAIITLANYEWFKEWENERVMKRGDDYNDIKDAIGEKLWQQTVKLFPQIEDKRVFFEVGSPLSNNHYIAAPRGEIYGIDHCKERFAAEAALALRGDTPIPGLYLTGQDIFCCGFSGAMFGGLLTASKVLGRNCFFDLMKFAQELRDEEKSMKKSN